MKKKVSSHEINVGGSNLQLHYSVLPVSIYREEMLPSLLIVVKGVMKYMYPSQKG